MWSAPPSFTGPKSPKLPPGTEALSKQITVNRSAAVVFDYVRSPSSWFEWQRHTREIRGAVDRVLTPGMQFDQQARFVGVDREVSWAVDAAGMVGGNTKMTLELRGREPGSNSTQNQLWSSYTVEGLPSSRCTVRHQVFFPNAKYSAEEQKARKREIDSEMREGLEMLRFNFHSKLTAPSN
eukprot:TRINITY_DN29314_c0_g1_i1.p1 TRINITY_DN29314_c0_g1~~TRINITY_DN29314_c0_g1_i1.p1  ORF type:complete len:181 (-),score=46.83 TRINITY_DN29314_c0_g1_i1:39-581(-)